MKLSMISFTETGLQLSEQIADKWKEAECALYTKCSSFRRESGQVHFVSSSIADWAKEQFEERNALVFIGACGIAVRAIAPHVTDKLWDSPVLVMDEKGQYVIPVLSGHMGGANELALSIAEKTGAEPVITTATDIQRKFAVDMFAKKNGLAIMNKDGIAKVSSKVLSGQSITLSVEPGHIKKDCKLPECIQMIEYPPAQKADIVITSEKREFETAILLRPKEYVIGMGCRRGREAEKIEKFILRNLAKLGISTVQIAALASIDVKKEEPGFLAWSRKENIPFRTYTAEELNDVKGDFRTSDFVKDKVGVDNVCERAALKACKPEGRLIYEKHAEDGMTIAVAKRDWRVGFDET